MKNLEAALELLDMGWSIIPCRPDTKRPRIKWKEFQETLPTEEQVTDWWTKFPDDPIALITGSLSGVVVVDCDNEEALHAAFDCGMKSPFRAKTKRGHHLYFRHPEDGIRRGPKAGINSRGSDWPKINGLDFRGDGSYALVPPSKNYSWEIPKGFSLDPEDFPVWEDWKPEIKSEFDDSFSFNDLDLSDVVAMNPIELMSEWDRTARYVRETYPNTMKIPSGVGNGRNERVMKYISEQILDGNFGAELRVRGYAFMTEFFEEHLSVAEFEATVRSMEESERRNHPDRFDEKGEYIHRKRIEEAKAEENGEGRSRRLITMGDAKELAEKSEAREFLIEPWLSPASITQVYGYSGHGKSLFVQNAMASLASGRKYFGCFEINKPSKILYLDFEMGMSTIARRLLEMKQVHGDTKDRLQIWTPFVDNHEMNLRTKEGLVELQGWVDFIKPDVIVVDTIRTAYPGLMENSSDEWAKVNQLAVRLRNSGYAVILVHHSNKPSENGVGREAGSTNQLTVLETQIRVTQVYQDEETAKQNAAIYDGSYDRPVWPMLSARLMKDFQLYMVMEIRYGKVREWTDSHDRVQWIGLAANNQTDERCIVSSRSTKQIAKDLALDGKDVEEISRVLSKPLRVIKDWLEV